MLGLSTALSGIRANRIALEVVAQNIANASTPGYHRQELVVSPRPDIELGGILVGQGVELERVRRIRDAVVEEAIRSNVQDRGYLGVLLDFARRVETLLSSETGSLDQLIDRFFLTFDQLSGRPDDMTLRRSLLNQAVVLADQFNSVAEQLQRFREITEVEMHSVVEQINRYAAELADLNVRIGSAELSGRVANNLRDRRDQILEQLSELVDIRVIEQEKGQVLVLVGGYALVSLGEANELTVEFQDDSTEFRLGEIPDAIPVQAGKLAGLREVHDRVLLGTRTNLDNLADTFMRLVDGLHATGIGLQGSHKTLTSVRAVSDPLVPLSEAVQGWPLQEGDLYISVTDESTGDRRLHRIHIDPETMTLNDLSAAIASLPNLTSVVNAATNQITIAATSGYTFDFTGRLPTSLDHSAVTGSARFSVEGLYTGDVNDLYTFEVVGSGEVGVTDGLSLRVTNSSGEVVGEFNIGSGYVPGDAITVGNGIEVRVTNGTLNSGDTVSAEVIAEPDTVGILAAVGLGGLFRGRGAASIQVRPELVDNPGLLAAGRTGQPGDGLLARRIGELRERQVLSDGTLTLSGYFLYLLTDVGAEIQQLDGQAAHVDLVLEQLNFERQSISGVDIEEEVVRMSQFQRGFEAAARVIQVINDALEDLMAAL